MPSNQIKMRGLARMAFRAVRADVAAEIEAGSTVKLSWLKHFGDQATPAVSYTHFADLVAREITGKAGSRGGKVPGKGNRSLPAPQTNSTPQSTLPDIGGPRPAIERNQPHESSEYKPRKFTDFGNLESSLERWYGPPKDEEK